MIKLDMHVHTEYSADSTLKLDSVAAFLNRHAGFALCITDHNEIGGAVELQKRFPDRIIVGEEIRTVDGEITGLFLKEKIDRDLSIEGTCDAILAQGGVIYIPHPMDRLRTSKLTPQGLPKALDRCHIIEVYNSRNVFRADDDAARRAATKLGKAMGSGSDSHTLIELGRSCAHLDHFPETGDDLIALLNRGTLCMRRSFIGVHFVTKYRKFIAKR